MRIAGVSALLIGMLVALFASNPQQALSGRNIINVTSDQGFLGIITLGAAVLIITGSIDLSIGSVVGFSAVLFGVLMGEGLPWAGIPPLPPLLAALFVVLVGCGIGAIYGLLVTKLRVQAFLVTLCGLFFYRGLARLISSGPVGMEGVSVRQPQFREPLEHLRQMAIGFDEDFVLAFPNLMVIFLALAVVVGVILHKSVIGRYWYAIGFNEQAAKYSGIRVDRYRILAHVLCSGLASLAGVLFLLKESEANPTGAGNLYELYAITGAVLGGCSLRGGEGIIIGVVLGSLVLRLLNNLLIFLNVPNEIEPCIIGLTLLGGAVADEFFRRIERRRK